jgi:hypothetical protein
MKIDAACRHEKKRKKPQKRRRIKAFVYWRESGGQDIGLE